MVSKEEVEHLARLSRLALTEKEKESLIKDLQSILGYISELNEVLVEDGAVSDPHALVDNVMRIDDNSNQVGVFTDDVLAVAPRVDENKYLKVKAVLDQNK